MGQYSTGLNAPISRSRSTISRTATVCTRPADKSAPHFVPQQWRNLIPHKPIEHSTRLLCIHQILVYIPRMRETLPAPPSS
jgi:hypothetical protein